MTVTAPSSDPLSSTSGVARDAGTYARWVRFATGGIKKSDGVTVFDIRDAVRGVCEAGT
ncbi:hypothetical protein [Streptomyces lavenduligriseus]|uniref:Uncharacterized protein n=1 Tax=Streptomyces lavenduligriseus TaxID=67315 RepID=A0ABT0P5W1_9ACTN|nr:hypothetical protein [Streptomyces lavenduligriseus]MCL3999119.1 hypothetical protein [Streptomyces lavenduligriseus]